MLGRGGRLAASRATPVVLMSRETRVWAQLGRISDSPASVKFLQPPALRVSRHGNLGSLETPLPVNSVPLTLIDLRVGPQAARTSITPMSVTSGHFARLIRSSPLRKDPIPSPVTLVRDRSSVLRAPHVTVSRLWRPLSVNLVQLERERLEMLLEAEDDTSSPVISEPRNKVNKDC